MKVDFQISIHIGHLSGPYSIGPVCILRAGDLGCKAKFYFDGVTDTPDAGASRVEVWIIPGFYYFRVAEALRVGEGAEAPPVPFVPLLAALNVN